MTTYNNFLSAQSLHAGGWLASDQEQLRTEYDLTEEELDAILAELAELELAELAEED